MNIGIEEIKKAAYIYNSGDVENAIKFMAAQNEKSSNELSTYLKFNNGIIHTEDFSNIILKISFNLLESGFDYKKLKNFDKFASQKKPFIKFDEETESIKHFGNFLRAYENLVTKGRYFD